MYSKYKTFAVYLVLERVSLNGAIHISPKLLYWNTLCNQLCQILQFYTLNYYQDWEEGRICTCEEGSSGHEVHPKIIVTMTKLHCTLVEIKRKGQFLTKVWYVH